MRVLVLGAGVIGTATAWYAARAGHDVVVVALFRLKADPAQWTWGARFLFECLAWRTRDNIAEIVKLSVYGRGSARALADILSGRKPEVDFAFTT